MKQNSWRLLFDSQVNKENLKKSKSIAKNPKINMCNLTTDYNYVLLNRFQKRMFGNFENALRLCDSKGSNILSFWC